MVNGDLVEVPLHFAVLYTTSTQNGTASISNSFLKSPELHAMMGDGERGPVWLRPIRVMSELFLAAKIGSDEQQFLGLGWAGFRVDTLEDTSWERECFVAPTPYEAG